jgi:hypothetical protein
MATIALRMGRLVWKSLSIGAEAWLAPAAIAKARPDLRCFFMITSVRRPGLTIRNDSRARAERRRVAIGGGPRSPRRELLTRVFVRFGPRA